MEVLISRKTAALLLYFYILLLVLLHPGSTIPFKRINQDENTVFLKGIYDIDVIFKTKIKSLNKCISKLETAVCI